MKDIEIRSTNGITMVRAFTIQSAIDDFVANHPDDEIIFVHDTKYSQVTKHFNHES